MHHTKEKGDLAVALVIADLTKKGYSVFTSLSEHLPFDLIAYDKETQKSFRIQVKYSVDGMVKNKTSWADKTGTHEKKYEVFDFDFYAVYLPTVDAIIYPSIDFGGKKIAVEPISSTTPAFWWEDFKTFTSAAKKKSFKDFGIIPTSLSNLKYTK